MPPNGSEVPFQDGKVEGNIISFKQTLKAQGLDLKYSGVLKDGAIDFTRVLPNGAQQFTAKKAVIDTNKNGVRTKEEVDKAGDGLNARSRRSRTRRHETGRHRWR